MYSLLASSTPVRQGLRQAASTPRNQVRPVQGRSPHIQSIDRDG
uniref:Uncharacterized protein n=1 Tax=Setaria italica TaxID=4555 RepID=K3Y4A5_SETIT